MWPYQESYVTDIIWWFKCLNCSNFAFHWIYFVFGYFEPNNGSNNVARWGMKSDKYVTIPRKLYNSDIIWSFKCLNCSNFAFHWIYSVFGYFEPNNGSNNVARWGMKSDKYVTIPRKLYNSDIIWSFKCLNCSNFAFHWIYSVFGYFEPKKLNFIHSEYTFLWIGSKTVLNKCFKK